MIKFFNSLLDYHRYFRQKLLSEDGEISATRRGFLRCINTACLICLVGMGLIAALIVYGIKKRFQMADFINCVAVISAISSATALISGTIAGIASCTKASSKYLEKRGDVSANKE